MLNSIDKGAFKLKGAQAVGFVIGVLLAYFIFAMILGFISNYMLHQFGADWSSFWGCTIGYLLAPIVRIWVVGRAD